MVKQKRRFSRVNSAQSDRLYSLYWGKTAIAATMIAIDIAEAQVAKYIRKDFKPFLDSLNSREARYFSSEALVWKLKIAAVVDANTQAINELGLSVAKELLSMANVEVPVRIITLKESPTRQTWGRFRRKTFFANGSSLLAALKTSAIEAAAAA